MKIYKYVFHPCVCALMFILLFSSCSKNEILPNGDAKINILTFENHDEFMSTLKEVISFNHQERKDRISFGKYDCWAHYSSRSPSISRSSFNCNSGIF